MPQPSDDAPTTDRLTVDVVDALDFDGFFGKALCVCGAALLVVFLVGVAVGVMIAA